MCGIVGYVGSANAQEFLLAGLRRLEYRGYDSAGIGMHGRDGRLQLAKAAGRVATLGQILEDHPLKGSAGIGHTRWATHGPATDANAHPHIGGLDDRRGPDVVVVHNGVIENYLKLKKKLELQGYVFQSNTDTEVAAHLIAHSYRQLREQLNGGATNLGEVCLEALRRAVGQLKGTYGLAVLFRDCPNTVFAARLGSPLVIGVGNGEHFLASDVSPLHGHTERIIYLADHELAMLTPDSHRVIHREQGQVAPDIRVIEEAGQEAELGEFPHYMLKEIFEQPKSLADCMRGRLNHDEATAHFGGLNLSPTQLRKVDRILLTACGTSWHAALVGEYLIEEIAGVPVEVEYASELRYRNTPIDRNTLLFAITQSGETADTLAALREVKRKGHPTLAICNVVGSSIARESDGGIYLHAGPEVGVASTKAFTSQVLTMLLLGLHLGRLRTLSFAQGKQILKALEKLPQAVEATLAYNRQVQLVAEKYAECTNFLYLGRHYNFPVALEGALKLKEISYIHAEGYPAAEMKHGPIALVDEKTPSVFINPKSIVYDKVISNIQEVKARRGPVIGIAEEGDMEMAGMVDDVLTIPVVEDFLQPIVASIPLQLLAYHIAVLRGCDVDKPRNLAKSVTVE
jgi:glucosamine--fructose-6-phosphate aminotransferase (isomerizing)